jgi:hypothetical protein
MSASFRFVWLCLLGLAMTAFAPDLAAQKMTRKQTRMLTQLQEDYSKAIRWNDFEGAASLLDPEYRKVHPITDAEFSRYEQIQVTGFASLDSRVLPDGSVLRAVRIDLVNRNTLTQRSMRFTERWRYDAQAKRWWLTSGLPDFWQGN